MGISGALPTLAAIAISLGAFGRASAQTPSERHPIQESPSIGDRAMSMLGSAGGSAKEAALWVEDGVAAIRVGERASALVSAARSEYEDAFVRARALQDRALGLRLLGPESGSSVTDELWFAIAPGEELPERLVLLVHGLDEPGDVWLDLAPRLRDAGFTVARFDYPNDQSPGDAAVALADALRGLRAAGVRRVDLVGHSMGGLVCRDLLTRPGLYGGDASARAAPALPSVERLVMMGTPHHGSVMAHLRAITELRDHLSRWIDADSFDPAALLGFLYDGRGEAGDDLLPCSDYLCGLNSRPLPTSVRLTSIVGAYSELTRPEIEAIFGCPSVRSVLGEERAGAWRRAADALVSAVGDGVVPVGSTQLAGVEDVVTVAANHRTMIRSIGLIDAIERLAGVEPGPPPAIPVILDRLAN